MASNIPNIPTGATRTSPGSPQPPLFDWNRLRELISRIAERVFSYFRKEPTALLPFLIKSRSSAEEQVLRTLGLDTWQTLGKKKEACDRIIRCFLEKETSLSLTNLGLSTLPDSLGELVHLQNLFVDHNQLVELPSSMKNLVNLQKLYLNFNLLPAVPPVIEELTNLQTLELSHNKLKILPETICKLSNLQHLFLGCNQLTDLPNSIGKLSKLQGLYLSGNLLIELPISVLQLSATLTITLTNSIQSGLAVARLEEAARQSHSSMPHFSISA